MKILLVHADRQPWATQRRAEALKWEWKDDEVDIVDRWHLPKVNQYDVIQVLFSGGVTKIKSFILENKDKMYLTLASRRTLDYRWDKKEDLIEVFSNAVNVVCQNRGLAYDVDRMTEKTNAVYIPNGVDEKMFNRKMVIGFVGAFGSEGHKGLRLAKKACEELDMKLVVAQNIPYDKMPDFYNRIDCLLIPSESEGCNNPILEAMAMNKQVISTSVGIASELESVILTERSVDGIKEALEKVSGRIQILEEHTWSYIANQYHKLYE